MLPRKRTDAEFGYRIYVKSDGLWYRSKTSPLGIWSELRNARMVAALAKLDPNDIDFYRFYIGVPYSDGNPKEQPIKCTIATQM